MVRLAAFVIVALAAFAVCLLAALRARRRDTQLYSLALTLALLLLLASWVGGFVLAFWAVVQALP